MKNAAFQYSLAITVLLVLSGFVFSQDCAQQDYKCKIDAAAKRVAADPGDAEAYYDRARAYYRFGNPEMAIADYSKYISLKPTNSEYLSDGYSGRADSYRKKGNTQSAFADYNKAISIAPLYANGYIGRGNAYVEQNNYVLALADFNKAVQVGPDNAESYYGRARVYEHQKKWNAAIADFDKYLSMKTEDDAYLSDGYYARGFCYFSKLNYIQAVADYSKAIELHPTPAMYRDRAAAYRKLGKVSLAEADEQQAAQ